MPPLDGVTRQRVKLAVARAGFLGRDIAEYLNSYGLLASSWWKRQVQADAIATLAERMSAHPATTWHTEQVARWLREQADQARKG